MDSFLKKRSPCITALRTTRFYQIDLWKEFARTVERLTQEAINVIVVASL